MFTKKRIFFLLGIVLVISIILFLFLTSRKSPPTPTPFPKPSPQYFDQTKHQALIYEDPNKNFQISETNKEYLIVVLGNPFSSYRPEAEKAFLSLLRISESEACKLNVLISTPYFANPDESGKTYPLSFCSQP